MMRSGCRLASYPWGRDSFICRSKKNKQDKRKSRKKDKNWGLRHHLKLKDIFFLLYHKICMNTFCVNTKSPQISHQNWCCTLVVIQECPKEVLRKPFVLQSFRKRVVILQYYIVYRRKTEERHMFHPIITNTMDCEPMSSRRFQSVTHRGRCSHNDRLQRVFLFIARVCVMKHSLEGFFV